MLRLLYKPKYNIVNNIIHTIIKNVEMKDNSLKLNAQHVSVH